MSGIAGLFLTDARPASRPALERMVETIKHRGPQQTGLWTDGSVGLGHCLFATTPETLHEPLPFYDALRNLAVTADARIDNRADLLPQLDFGPLPPSEIPDSLLILRAYEKWGEDCPEKLLGDFAFALWDGKRQALFCARDPFGVRPFFYYHGQGLFAFASEIKALLALPDVPRRINENRVLESLATYCDNEADTFYQNIFSLPPAHQMRVDANGQVLRRYWNLNPTRELRLRSDARYAEAFRECFLEAVRCQVRRAGRVGSTLSGGLDSSSIACAARDFLRAEGGAPLPTFSLIFDDVPQSDERSFMQAALDRGGMEAHFIRGDKIGPLWEVDEVLRHEDEPFHAPNLFLHWAMYREAKNAGISILLDGLDGDTTVSHGIARLPEMARRGQWPGLLREARLLALWLRQAQSPIRTDK